MKIFVSGVNSGTNPSPGVGVARSIRAAFPDVPLVAVDSRATSSGLRWPDFDEHLVRPAWPTRPRAQAAFVSKVMARGDIWLSCSDAEVALLSRLVRSRRLPCPPPSALDKVKKPPTAMAEQMGMASPPLLLCGGASDGELARFCRYYGYPVWVKGMTHDAVPVGSTYELPVAVKEMAALWGGRHQVFLQAHVEGAEVGIAFAAWRGALLGAVFMEKLERTSEGKAWSGRMGPVPRPVEDRLREVLAELRWSGGGELECVRDGANRLWLIECNPRFPAWIYGACLGGCNLPGRLVAAMTDRPLETRRPATRRRAFTRVVVEVPTGA